MIVNSVYNLQRLCESVSTICYWEYYVWVMHAIIVKRVSATSLYDDVVLSSVVKESCSLLLIQSAWTPGQSSYGWCRVLFLAVILDFRRYFPVSWPDGIEKDVCLASSLRAGATKVPDNCVEGLLPTTWSDDIVVREIYGKMVHINGHCFPRHDRVYRLPGFHQSVDACHRCRAVYWVKL